MRAVHPSARQFSAFPSFSELQELCLPDLMALELWLGHNPHQNEAVQEARQNLLRERLNFFHSRR